MPLQAYKHKTKHALASKTTLLSDLEKLVEARWHTAKVRRGDVAVQARVCVCQKERHPIVRAARLQAELQVRTVVDERERLYHLPEHPLDTDSDLRQIPVVVFLRGGEVRSFEAAVDVTEDRIRGVAVDLALNVVPLLHLCKPVVQVALGQEVGIVASAGLHVNVPDDSVRKHHGLPRQPVYLVMSIITLALEVVISARTTRLPDRAVDKTDDVRLHQS